MKSALHSDLPMVDAEYELLSANRRLYPTWIPHEFMSWSQLRTTGRIVSLVVRPQSVTLETYTCLFYAFIYLCVYFFIEFIYQRER